LFLKQADQRPRTRIYSVPFHERNSLLLKSSRPKTKDQNLFLSKKEIVFSQKQETKDQGPAPIQFLFKEEIDFFSKAADQRPRIRSYSVPFQGRNCLLLKNSIQKTKDQIRYSSFSRQKLTSFQRQQTKDQGPDFIQFLLKERKWIWSLVFGLLLLRRSKFVYYK
jgi:hypothetical protein